MLLGKLKQNKGFHMQSYKCVVCGYVYDPSAGDPSGGIEPGVSFDDLPDDYICPICGAGKDEFFPND
jgi:rubredoxin